VSKDSIVILLFLAFHVCNNRTIWNVLGHDMT
jgi:hypothetical protein